MSTETDYQPDQPRPEKAFEIRRKEDPDLHRILRARMDVITDPQLNDGARNLFVLLLDLSLDPQLNNRKRGQIAISTTQLSERLARCDRAIYGWTKQLEREGHIWLSKKFRPNTAPMNVFHVSALQEKKQEAEELPNDGLWGNGKRRGEFSRAMGARGGYRQTMQVLVDASGNPLTSQVAQNEPGHRNFCGSPPQSLRVAPARNDTCPPQSLRVGTAQNDTCPPQSLRLPTARNDTYPRHGSADLTESGDVSGSVSEGFNVQRCGNAIKGGARKGREGDFFSDLASTLEGWRAGYAAQELSQSGPWWRQKFQGNPQLSWRVLAEIGRMIKEKEPFSRNPGAAAVDLFKRWSA